jgi:hypothetical protein
MVDDVGHVVFEQLNQPLFFGLHLGLNLLPHFLTLLVNRLLGLFNRIDRHLFSVHNRLLVFIKLVFQGVRNFGFHVLVKLGGRQAQILLQEHSIFADDFFEVQAAAVAQLLAEFVVKNMFGIFIGGFLKRFKTGLGLFGYR